MNFKLYAIIIIIKAVNMNIPKSCVACMFDYSCNSGYEMKECKYYGMEQPTMKEKIKILFGKFFK
jgi:hypothetical protein